MLDPRHRRLWTALVVVALGCGGGETVQEEAAEPAAAPEPAAADPDIAPAGDPTGLPMGFAVRLDDEGADAAAFHVTSEGEAMHIQTGPAGIFYNESVVVPDGDYSVSATFTEIEAPADHREAFGIIIGGSDLQGPNQRYTYFLVRADGSYLIKQRAGEETSNVTDAWTESAAVNASTGGGEVTNALEVRVTGDQVHFLVNDQEVEVVPASEIDAYGIAGVRINHNLDVRVSDFAVNRS